MANRLGHEYKLFVDNGSGAYTAVAGQTELTLDQPQDLIDVTAKGDPLKIRAPGRPDFTAQVSGFVRVPDPNGYERLNAMRIAQTAVNVQVRFTPFGSTDLVFAGPVYVSNLNRGMTDQQGATWAFQLTASAAATTDGVGA